MANAATRAQGKNGKTRQQAPQLPVIPFTHAAHEHVEPAFDRSLAMTVNVQQLGPFDVPAFGYLRSIWLLVEGSGGVLGPGVLSADAPYSAIQDIALLDVNGAPIFGPFNGYEVYLANKWGGYQFRQDPANQPNFSNTVNPVFAVRIPVEVAHKTGLGALSNMNASANYKVQVSLAASTSLFTTAPTTLPTVRVRGWLEAWTLPQPTSRDGLPQATMPPLHGTAQYWSKFQKQIVAGENTVILPRVGNQIRNLIAVFYDDSATPVRISTEYPDPLRINWDARQLINEARSYRQQSMFERYGVTLDTGVFVYDFCHDDSGHPGGDDDGHLWLRTVQATRLELVGSWTGSGGNLTILTNDVAPVAVAGRFEEESASGGVPGAGEGFTG